MADAAEKIGSKPSKFAKIPLILSFFQCGKVFYVN